MINPRLLIGGGGSFVPPVLPLLCLFNGQDGDAIYAIGAASSADGVTWTEEASPVLVKGAGGTWDDDHVKDPCLLWDGSQYVTYYSGHDGTKYQTGRATAPSWPPTWTKDAGNPVITVGSGGSFDDAGVLMPTVLYEPSDTGRRWKLWYGANDGSVITIGYAHSNDGVTWTKVGQVATAGAGGTWNDEGVIPFAIRKDAGVYSLFYGGRQGTSNPRWQGGRVTFTDPEGTYTPDGGNPILLARFNDTGTSQAISGTVSIGATTVTMTSTAAFSVGEPIVLADADSETETHRIASIDSGTDLTFDGVTLAAFAGGSGGVLRSFAYNAVVPRSVIDTVSAYQMFGTPFQPVEDLSPGGDKLREGSFRWTATELGGPWAYDYVTVTDSGLMFDLYPATTGWHKFSAENPSVIYEP